MVLLTMILNAPCTHTLCHMTLELLLLKEKSLFPQLTPFDLGFSHLTCFGQYSEAEVTACCQLSAQALTGPDASACSLTPCHAFEKTVPWLACWSEEECKGHVGPSCPG